MDYQSGRLLLYKVELKLHTSMVVKIVLSSDLHLVDDKGLGMSGHESTTPG